MAATSVAGQGTVGQRFTTPWWDGSFEETQGWGPSPLSLEPEGHGYAHWHAGADIGLPCGTHLKLPGNLQQVRAVWVDNPGGYGTALMLQLGLPILQRGVNVQRTKRVDVWLGHLRQRLVSDGEIISGGKEIALSNNTGNSTGCHVHFEVRPGGARYGTDIDPSATLLTGDPAGSPGSGSTTTTDDQNPYNPFDPRYEVWNLEHSVSTGVTALAQELVGLGQVALGSVVLIAGVGVTIMALRGRSLPQIGEAVAGTVRGARKRQQAGQAEHRRGVEAIRSTGERETRRQVAREALEVRRQGREEAAAAAEQRRNTLGSYRAGLISRRVAQERLGEPVRATGKRPSRVAFGSGFTGPGVYRRGRTTVDVRRAAISRVRPSHQRAARAKEPPFGGQIQ